MDQQQQEQQQQEQQQQESQEDSANVIRRQQSLPNPPPASSIAWAPPGSAPSRGQRMERQTTEKRDNRTFQTQEEDDDEHSASLQDRLASSALAATLELLKLAGGVTLSTTGKLVTPPLQVTQQFLLPVLWEASLNSLANNTPTRVKDWFRIVSSSIANFYTVLANTPSGKHLRGRLLVVWCDLLDCLTADVTRQAFLDGTACWIKWAQMIHTPECHAYIEQVCIWGCRVLQAASHGRNQQLLHNIAAAVKSASQCLADPRTTLALAEVTAYLCYALEMEQKFQHEEQDGDYSTKSSIPRERRDYERATNIHRQTFVRDPEATVEQVILSSMGISNNTTNATDETTYDETSVPSRIVCSDVDDRDVRQRQQQEDDTSSKTGTDGGASVDWEQESSLRQQVDAASVTSTTNKTQEVWTERVRKDIDVDYLRQQILATQQTTAKKHNTGDVAVAVKDAADIEDLASESRRDYDPKGADKRTRMRVQIQPENTEAKTEQGNVEEGIGWTDIPNAMPLEGESSVQHFYRVLNEILEEKRNAALRTHYQEHHDDDKNESMSKGRVWKKPGKGLEEFLRQTIAQRIADGVLPPPVEETDRVKSMLANPKNRTYIYWAMVAGTLLALLWFGLGLYGLFKLLFPTVATVSIPAAASPQTQEIVIRVIREVGADDSIPKSEIAECVATALG